MRPRSTSSNARPGERGAALLTVLLLVAVMAVITALALDRLTLATRMAQNSVGAGQARAFLQAGEVIVAYKIGDAMKASPAKTTVAGDWLDSERTMPVPGGAVTARMTDAGNCFNINGLTVKGGADSYGPHAAGTRQFVALMRALGIDQRVAEGIAAATTDWIDTDAIPEQDGAEDPYYLALRMPYRTSGGLMADPSELRAVKGMTPALYSRIRPWVCTLPVAELSTININTLLPDQAILLSALTSGKVSPAVGRQVLAARPVGGYASTAAFWALPQLARLDLPADVQAQTAVVSRWFSVDLRANLGGTDVSETALFDGRDAPARLVRRRWGDES
jgi:general secretion pathway protein K